MKTIVIETINPEEVKKVLAARLRSGEAFEKTVETLPVGQRMLLTLLDERVFVTNALTRLVNKNVVLSFHTMTPEEKELEHVAAVQRMVEHLASIITDPARSASDKATIAETLMNHFRQTAANEAAKAV